MLLGGVMAEPESLEESDGGKRNLSLALLVPALETCAFPKFLN